MNRKSVLVLAVAGVLAGPAHAHDAGDMLLRLGIHNVDPKSDNSDIVDVESNARPTVNFTYMLTPNLGINLLAAWPFEHDIELKDGTRVGSTKHLPPTLSIQYHFLPGAAVQPYAGVGINYTTFFSEDTTGPLAGADLKLDDSWGLAAELGVDVAIDRDWYVNVDVRYIDIDSKAKVTGLDKFTVEIDPVVYGISIGRRF